MNLKITPDHVSRAAVAYVRQSTMAQVAGNLESQRRQYDLAKAAETVGFASVTVIDDDLGRSGSGTMQRPGFEGLVAMVCSGDVGAVYCIEASRLARNERDWHHLIDLCALAGALVIDPDGAYDPRSSMTACCSGLKGTMSEYELSLMRQRDIAARDSKAECGAFRFMLPPGFCGSEAGKIEIDPDQHVAGTIRLVFTKFRELGSARQVFLEVARLSQRHADPSQPAVRWKYREQPPRCCRTQSEPHRPRLAKTLVEAGEAIATADNQHSSGNRGGPCPLPSRAMEGIVRICERENLRLGTAAVQHKASLAAVLSWPLDIGAAIALFAEVRMHECADPLFDELGAGKNRDRHRRAPWLCDASRARARDGSSRPYCAIPSLRRLARVRPDGHLDRHVLHLRGASGRSGILDE
jgi:DNA invertase Pin-like site-specific DNA recombinase